MPFSCDGQRCLGFQEFLPKRQIFLHVRSSRANCTWWSTRVYLEQRMTSRAQRQSHVYLQQLKKHNPKSGKNRGSSSRTVTDLSFGTNDTRIVIEHFSWLFSVIKLTHSYKLLLQRFVDRKNRKYSLRQGMASAWQCIMNERRWKSSRGGDITNS